MRRRIAAIALLLALTVSAAARAAWDEPVRGSWVIDPATPHAVLLAEGDRVAEIVVDPDEHSAVHQAAKFLQQDLLKITGAAPRIVPEPSGEAPAVIHLVTLGVRPVPDVVDAAALEGQWEAFQIVAAGREVYLVGSNFRGTAFAVYTLSERLGIDPLYHWTGYTPTRHNPLAMRPVDYRSGPPTFKYRGLFHDDEDILPRPIDPATGYPSVRGQVPTEWYERYFETALRLKMNMVAPYVRTVRTFEVQKMASDWGLYYTSHHYDTLLSNPYGFRHFGLAARRGVTGGFDWFNNREGMLAYWRAGVLENRELDAIWPVGMRGTDDVPYTFPPNMTDDEKARVYQEIIDLQVAMVKELLPSEKEPVFHFTLYNEMLNLFRLGKIQLPDEVILVWDDNGDGIMRALPTVWDHQLAKRHGVYYHLAFFGATHKQTVHTVTPLRVADQFAQIVEAGATEFVLVNVSELREYIMEARMIADIAWDAEATLGRANPAQAYVDWWSREYFGDSGPDVARSYYDYYRIIDAHNKIWWGAVRVDAFVEALRSRFAGAAYELPSPEALDELRERARRHAEALAALERTASRLSEEQRQFLFEHVAFGLLIDYRPVQAALLLAEALAAPTLGGAFAKAMEAFGCLRQLEEEIARAERPPFEGWYRATWIRPADYRTSPGNSYMNPHRSYLVVRDFLVDVGGFKLVEPADGAKAAGKVTLRFAPAEPLLPLSRVAVKVGGQEVYAGTSVPRELTVDVTGYPDGPLYVEVSGEAGGLGLTFTQMVRLSVANGWTLFDPLAAPAVTWFGTINEEKIKFKTDGWRYDQGQADRFFRDESRLVRTANSTEHLVWAAPKLLEAHVTLYAAAEGLKEVLALAVSADGTEWYDLPYTLNAVDRSGEWTKYVVFAAVQGAGPVELFRVTLKKSAVPFAAVQVGEVQLRGSNL